MDYDEQIKFIVNQLDIYFLPRRIKDKLLLELEILLEQRRKLREFLATSF